MKKQSTKSGKLVGGLSAQKMMVPIILVLAVLHAMIVTLILQINSTSTTLSMNMRKYDQYISDATSLLADSSLRSETTNTFVLMPVKEDGTVNYQPLIAYAEELDLHRLGSQVAERFEGYQVGEEARDSINAAAENSDKMYSMQLHALALMSSVYPLPDMAPLAAIDLSELTAQEQEMTDAQKEAAARKLVLGSEYSEYKSAVSKNVNAAVAALRQESGQKSGQLSARVGIMRATLWVVTLLIIVVLSFTFILLNNLILTPLTKFVNLIDSNYSLNDKKGAQEIRLLASAYNDLMWRRDALDEILRSAAETDTLTNLPNRYKYEQCLVDFGKSGYSLALFLFDINFLKVTNDKYGHAAGDQLIKTAADCIASSFDLSDTNIEGEAYCFRFGGDEFAALVKNCTEEGARQLAERFEAEQEHDHISVSTGYAYTSEISQTSFKKLMKEADKQMYAQKEVKHKQDFEYRVPAGATT